MWYMACVLVCWPWLARWRYATWLENFHFLWITPLGEIDIIEGVHNQLTNQYTLHASADCILPKVSEDTYLAKLLGTTCTSSPGANSGCAYIDTDHRTYGKGFNLAQGGVFAHLWNDAGVTMWRFFRDSIPADITAKKPNPSTWGTPAAIFPSHSCDMKSHFFNHSLILDISLCGDYAGSAYANSGCPGTCADAVANSTNFNSEPRLWIDIVLMLNNYSF